MGKSMIFFAGACSGEASNARNYRGSIDIEGGTTNLRRRGLGEEGGFRTCKGGETYSQRLGSA